jgi:hypothetical protein
LQEAQDYNVGVSGEKLMRLYSSFGKKSRDAWGQGKAELGEAYGELQDTLLGMVERQASDPDLMARWGNARQQWRYLKVLERPGVVTKGNVNPASLNTALGKMFKGEYARAGDVRRGAPNDLFDASRITNWMGDVVGDSGTATRSAWAALGRNPGALELMTAAGSRMVSAPVMNAYMRASPDAAAAFMAPAGAAARAGAQASGGILSSQTRRGRRGRK